MTLFRWIAGGSVLSWLAASATWGLRTGVEILLGMFAPLLAVSISCAVVKRTHARAPQRLTSLMAKAFAGKMIFFGLYVALMLGLLSVRPRPFIISFTSYFIVLYLVEALWLQRLFARGWQGLK